MNITFLKGIVKATLIASLICCVQKLNAQSVKQNDSSAIYSQFSRFQQALLMRDTLSINDFYTEDAISLRQNESVRRGRNLISQRWKKSLANPIAIKVASLEINLSPGGQEAYQFGLFEVHTADESSQLLASGKIMFIWRKQPDGWRITLEMDNFNSLQPPKSPAQMKQ